MTDRESNPWESSLPGHAAPPPWHGPAQVHRLDNQAPAAQPEAPRRRRRKLQPQAANPQQPAPEREEVQQLARQAVDALMQVLPPWSLITPGSAKEDLAQRVWPGLWWPLLASQPPSEPTAPEDAR